MKQGVLSNWILVTDQKTSKHLVELNNHGKTIHRDMYKIDDKSSADDAEISPIIAAPHRKRARELTWNQRASMIFRFLHPDIKTPKDPTKFARK